MMAFAAATQMPRQYSSSLEGTTCVPHMVESQSSGHDLARRDGATARLPPLLNHRVEKPGDPMACGVEAIGRAHSEKPPEESQRLNLGMERCLPENDLLDDLSNELLATRRRGREGAFQDLATGVAGLKGGGDRGGGASARGLCKARQEGD